MCYHVVNGFEKFINMVNQWTLFIINYLFNWIMIILMISLFIIILEIISSAQSLSSVWLYETPWTAAH